MKSELLFVLNVALLGKRDPVDGGWGGGAGAGWLGGTGVGRIMLSESRGHKLERQNPWQTPKEEEEEKRKKKKKKRKEKKK